MAVNGERVQPKGLRNVKGIQRLNAMISTVAMRERVGITSAVMPIFRAEIWELTL